MSTSMAKAEPQTLVPAEPQSVSLIQIIERAARDSSVDVDKMERLMLMHERMVKRQSEELFNAAMSEAQKDMRPVAADANNPQTKSKYASYNALDRALRPIYGKHGFGLSFDTGECPTPGWVRVLCYVTHAAGGARTYHVDMPADGKGAKGGDVMTLTHAVGAGLSYGSRYLLKLIFNVAVGEDDRDGNDVQAKPAAPAPSGFDDWFQDFALVAEEGIKASAKAWHASSRQFREYAEEHHSARLDVLHDKAKAVDTAAKTAGGAR